jgi:hypothetical protein
VNQDDAHYRKTRSKLTFDHLLTKYVKVCGQKTMALRAPMAPMGTGAASSKAAPSKVAPSHTKFVPKAGATLRASVPPKAGATVKATMPKSAATPAVPKAGVLKISIGLKRPSAELSQVLKGKQVKFG